MEQSSVFLGLFGVMFLSIIEVYVWTIKIYKDAKTCLADVYVKVDKQMVEIYRILNSHLQNGNIHRDEKYFVPTEVCNALHVATKEKINDISTTQKVTQKDLSDIAGDVKAILAKVNKC